MKLRPILVALAIACAMPLVTAACSDAQVAQFDNTITDLKAKALARLKLRSTQFVKLVEQVAGKVPLGAADDLLTKARQNDKEIQAATELRAGLSVYARALVDTGDDVLALAEKFPVVGDYANALRSAVHVMHAIADRPEAAADDEPATNPETKP